MTINMNLCEPPSHRSMKDERGGYEMTMIKDRNGFELATYLWTPPSGLSSSKAVLFALHGILYHSTFDWLAPDDENRRVELNSSIIARLLSLNVMVIAHDHPGHGRSSGVRVHVDNFDDLVSAFRDVVEYYAEHIGLRDKFKMVMGFSMGGTVSVRAAMVYPDLIDAYILVSPALRAPPYMASLLGRVIRAAGDLVSRVAPTLQVLWLPRNPDPILADAVDKDENIARVALRARMAAEILRVYDIIDANTDEIQFKHVAVFLGKSDPVVYPQPSRDFGQRILSADKHTFEYEGVGHEIFRETRGKPAIDQCMDWIKERLPNEN